MPGRLQHPIAFIILFSIGWCVYILLLTYLISWISGWQKLARRFRFEGIFQGRRWSFQSAQLRRPIGNYNRILKLGADPTGLYMAMPFLFRIGHPPLLIPWPEITVFQGEKGLVFKYRELNLGREEPVSLRIRTSLAAKLQQAAGAAWPVETLG